MADEAYSRNWHTTPQHEIAAAIEACGPSASARLRHELGGEWMTCAGCPALRVFDFHYFYCRKLGDQTKPDKWNAGWRRLAGISWRDALQVPCSLPEIARLTNPNHTEEADNE